MVNNLKQFISIARDTPLHVVDRVPELIGNVVNQDENLKLGICRLSSISDYSLDFMFTMESIYTDVGGVFGAMTRINRGILETFAANGIEIPLPTRVEIQKTIS